MYSKPHLFLAIFWGLPTSWSPSQVPKTEKKINKKAIVVNGRKTTDNKWVPERWSMLQFNDLILKNIFACQSEFGKEGAVWNFMFLFWPGTTDRDLGVLTLVRILPYPLLFSANFPLDFPCILPCISWLQVTVVGKWNFPSVLHGGDPFCLWCIS